MSYFDPENDSQYLHASVRGHEELEAVAEMAEQDVLAKSGYELGETGGVAQALRRTIADVVSHRLRYYDTDATLSLESRGSRSQARAKGSLDPMWPKRWRWRLRSYDEVVYAP